MDLCAECTKDVKAVIDLMPADLSCVAVSAAFTAACEAAIGETGVGTVACAVGGAIVYKLCEEHGWPWVKSHSGEVAHEICVAAKLC